MPRLLQVNTAGAWKNVLSLRADDARAMDNAKTAVVLLADASDDAVSWRIVDRASCQEDVTVAAWDRQRGWRQCTP